MSSWVQVFLALLLAHVLGDFPLQTRHMVAGKRAFHAAAFGAHGLVHLLVAIASLALFTPLPLSAGVTVAALALLVPGHLLLDLGKSMLQRAWPARDGALLYCADQAAHALLVALSASVAVRALPPVAAVQAAWMADRQTILVFFIVVGATVFPAGYLIRYLLRPLSDQLRLVDDPARSGESLEGLGNAGLYLGWLERGLLVIAFSMSSFTAVGLIIGAKSIARFPEFRSRAFAEYFLIGTLISVAIAAAGGWILHGSLSALR